MKQIILNFIATLMLALAPMAAFSGNAYAACGSASGAKDQVLQGVGATSSDCSDKGVNQALKAAVQILSFVAGAAAVIMIILAGFKYITSGGDSGKVGNAKSTLIYALVGIAIAILAQLLLKIVFTQAQKAAGA